MTTLTSYQNDSRKHIKTKNQAIADAQAARAAAAEVPEPITEGELLECIDQYNQVETAAHELKRVIYAWLSRRKGYRQLRVGADIFNGSPAAFSQWEMHDPLKLIKVENLGSE